MGIFLKLFLLFMFVLEIEARPISYSGGHTLMHFNDGAQRWDRTTDTRIFSPLLYQLSYLGLN